MAGRAGGSRLNPMYLFRRHAGTAFMLMAMGLAAGAAWRSLAEPTLYTATATAQAAATAGLDWAGKNAEWQQAAADGGVQEILTNNLRHAVKLAATAGGVDETRLAGELLLLRNGTSFPASLLTGLPGRAGPSVVVRTADITEKLDAQSLAAIAADLDPPSGGVRGGWDFSFFQPASGAGPVLARPGQNDYSFRVFYHLYSLLNGGAEAAGPEAARQAAAAEVAARLDRETQFAGGGGFGPVARRELMREIQAIPFLAAADLYDGGLYAGGGDSGNNGRAVWRGRWAGMEISLRGDGEAGTAGAEIGFNLYPLTAPRDTPATRVQPLAAAVAVAYFSAREAGEARAAGRRAAAARAEAARAAANTAGPTATAVEIEAVPDEPAEPPARTRTVVREEIDEEAAAALQEKISSAEESLLSDKAALPALTRRFAAARDDAARLSVEAVAARARADRFRERYDDAARAEAEGPPVLSAETARLLAERDGLARRLAALLAYCTEEHPFVVEARRNMAAIDLLLTADGAGAAAAGLAAEERATRIANLYLEWETAAAAADGADERLRRKTDDADRAQTELTELEGRVLRGEAELGALRTRPVPMRRVEVEIEAPAEVEAAEAEPEPEPAPEPARVVPVPASPQAPAAPAVPALRVSLPAAGPLLRRPPGLMALWAGLAAGLVAAIAVAAVREVRGGKFHRAGEAARLVGLPVLAALRAYDGKSMRAAAKTVKGEVLAAKGRFTFAPPPVEFSEPPPAAKRGKIGSRRKAPRIAAWAAAALFVLLAGALHRLPAGLFVPAGVAEPSVPVYAPPAPASRPEEQP